jgi:hypothetical protein
MAATLSRLGALGRGLLVLEAVQHAFDDLPEAVE